MSKKLERKYNSVWRWYVNYLKRYSLTPMAKNLTPTEVDKFLKIHWKFQEKIMNLGIVPRWNS